MTRPPAALSPLHRRRSAGEGSLRPLEERLAEAFGAACERWRAKPRELDPESLAWFPERAWVGGSTCPYRHSTQGEETDDPVVEFFGHVSFVRPEDGEPTDFQASADFTDVTGDDNPEWKVDLNDDVIGHWHADGDRGGEVTLIWGLPMVRGAVAATAELDEQTIDQTAITTAGYPDRRRRRARVRRRPLPRRRPLGPPDDDARPREPLRGGLVATSDRGGPPSA